MAHTKCYAVFQEMDNCWGLDWIVSETFTQYSLKKEWIHSHSNLILIVVKFNWIANVPMMQYIKELIQHWLTRHIFIDLFFAVGGSFNDILNKSYIVILTVWYCAVQSFYNADTYISSLSLSFIKGWIYQRLMEAFEFSLQFHISDIPYYCTSISIVPHLFQHRLL